jgi:hypothetical protein
MSTVILVPRRDDGGERDALWAFARKHWEGMGVPIFCGDHLDGPFNRGAGINTAAKLAGDWDTAIIIDSDVLIELAKVSLAVECAQRFQRVVHPFREYHALTPGGTKAIMNGFSGNWKGHVKYTWWINMSCCVVVPRSVWNEVGGFDERFVGWGWEDVAFIQSTDCLTGNHLRFYGDLWHLYHHRSPENNHASPLYNASKVLATRYIESRYDPDAMRSLLREPGGPRS